MATMAERSKIHVVVDCCDIGITGLNPLGVGVYIRVVVLLSFVLRK
jgi:hypothetical protein